MQRAVLGLLLGLAGCAPSTWVKADGTTSQADFLKDRYGCERDVRQSGHFGGGVVGQINMQKFFEECMVADGYVKQAANAPPPEIDWSKVPSTTPNMSNLKGY